MSGSPAPAASSSSAEPGVPALGLTLGPRHRERSDAATWTLVGPLDATAPARVDGGGLINPHGADWSIDWWIGADDRWYFPGREATVRQQRQGAGPVLTTSVRIPSGDAHQRVYGAMAGGREVIVVEIENDSPVPVALALALRPYSLGPESRGGVSTTAATPARTEGTAGGDDVDPRWPRTLRLAGPTLLLDDEPVLRLPRGPNQAAVRVEDDLADAVADGVDLDWPGGVATRATNAVLLYPLPHRTSLRFVIPSATGGSEPRLAATPVADPATVPDADNVARGWNTVVDGTTRFEFPDNGLTQLVSAARARLLLTTGDDLLAAVRRLDPEVGPILAALAAGGHRRELAAVPAALAEDFPTRLPGSPLAAAEVVAAVGPVLGVVGRRPDDALLEVVAQLTHLVDRAGQADATRLAQAGLAVVARAAGDTKAADHLDKLVAKAGARAEGDEATTAEDGAEAYDRVAALAVGANDAGSWGRDSSVDAARFVLAARRLLVDDRGDDVLLLPTFPTAWRGGNAELHVAPTRHGVVSYGIRWHGARPALLWQIDAATVSSGETDRPGPVVLRCPGLDPDWQSTEARGETLLAGSAEGLAAPPAPGEGFR
ncbi:MAG: hypothetical protein AAF962_08080 [Actinomycetota bacterium]